MLNLLISILGDSYDKVQYTMVESDYEQMLELILELEKMMIWNRNNRTPSYIHRWNLYSNEFSEADWEGRIRIMQNSLLEISAQVEQSQEVLQRELEKKMTESNNNLDKKIDEIYQILQAFIKSSSSKGLSTNPSN